MINKSVAEVRRALLQEAEQWRGKAEKADDRVSAQTMNFIAQVIENLAQRLSYEG